ncbi:hypothetical protein [Bacillus sp. SG-1]|uniref:hypothetical protein n=1 Tax=Bacillus sp. SG-1 TaxID=161544 RepID=UPI000154323C|nr:hypothetical protein [Bacillus sp. SG-1]EDL66660.1 hypothetical protein BSG1_04870 [Bacillus sp. SG-1]
MELNYKTSPVDQPVALPRISVRAVMNFIGVVIFGGLLLMPFTLPISLSSGFEFYQSEKIAMNESEFVEYTLFTLGSGVLYFLLANIYLRGQQWRRVFSIIIALLGLFSVICIFYLVMHS